MFTRRDGEKFPQEREEQSLLRTEHLPGTNDLLILTRLFASNDDRDDNFSQNQD
jgi:hypothetical protein